MNRASGQTEREEIVKGNFGALVTKTAAASLQPYERNVRATIPLASANDYDITLPPVGAVEHGAEFVIRGVRASGTYVDGGVRVVSAGDEVRATKIVDDKMTADGTDEVSFRNMYNQYWLQLQDVTT